MKKAFFFLSLITGLLAYSTATSAPQTDSVNSESHQLISVQLHESKTILDKADSTRLTDSLKRVELERQILELKISDKLRRTELKAEIDSLKKASAQRELRILHQIDSLRVHTPGIPVIFNKDTVLQIYSKIGPYRPSERALSIQSKIRAISEIIPYSEDSLKIIHNEETSDLYYGSIIILSVSERDALWMDMRKQDLALMYEKEIIASITKYKDQNNLLKNFLRIVLMLLIILIIFYMVKFLNKAISAFVRRISERGKLILKGFKIGEYEVLSADHQGGVVLWLLNLTKWIIIAAVLYLSVPLIFSIFPATDDVAKIMLGYITKPLLNIFWSFIGFIPELIAITIIITITYYFVRVLKFLSSEIENDALRIPGFYPDWARPTYNLLRIASYAFAFIVIFPYLPGSESPVFQVVLAFVGLLMALGSMSAVGNIMAGILITYMRPFKNGDKVKIGGVTGEVVQKTLLITRLKTIKNEEVTIPNSAVLKGHTINYSASAPAEGLMIAVSTSFDRKVDKDKVMALLVEAALNCENVLNDPIPTAFETSITESTIHYELNAYIDKPERSHKITSEIFGKIVEHSSKYKIKCLTVTESIA